MTNQLRYLITLSITLFLTCPEGLANENRIIEPGTAHRKQPNIVLIYGDDVDCETVFGQFPKQDPKTIPFRNLRKMAEQGLRFSNFHVTTPVCGPSRACLYTGQYAHHNGCRVNDTKSIRSSGFRGGYTTFTPNHELALWMKKSGYITAHVGKYLHADFQPDAKKGIFWKHMVPPGWDYFCLSLGSQYLGFPSYIKSTDRFSKSSGDEYRTDWDIRHSIGILQRHANGDNRNKPLMLCWSPIAAHITGNGSPMVAPRHKKLYTNAQIPGFETKIGGRPKNQIEEMKPLKIEGDQRDYLIDVYRDRLRAMKSIDEGIGVLRAELEKLGMLENTIFILTSDHGFRFAHHRHYGKRLPYDRITRVPFLVTGPGIPKNVECDKLLANIDIAPTLVDLAGGMPPRTCDGVSFAKLMFAPEQKELIRRDSIMIENWGEAVSLIHVIPATYSALRMQSSIYTEWASGGREFFDLKKDPEQEHNIYSELAPERQLELSEKLRGLRRSNSKPFFAETRFKSDLDTKRICASLKPVKFSGLVESDAGIKKVELEIRCQETGAFWTGRGWSKGRFGFDANLKQPGGLSSAWEFELDTNRYSTSRHANLAARKIDVSLVAIDSEKRRSREKRLSVTLSFADPETTIEDFNLKTKDAQKILTISGSASDLKSVAAVRVGFQHPVTRKYWDGKSWKKDYCHLEAVLEKSKQPQSNWSLSLPAPEESPRLIVIARAYNPNTLFDHSPAIKSILLANGTP